jgi:hypothetical protein
MTHLNVSKTLDKFRRSEFLKVTKAVGDNDFSGAKPLISQYRKRLMQHQI